jgi:hypothetical protein
MAAYLRPDLLILDDFELKSIQPPGQEDLYDVINERYEHRSRESLAQCCRESVAYLRARIDTNQVVEKSEGSRPLADGRSRADRWGVQRADQHQARLGRATGQNSPGLLHSGDCQNSQPCPQAVAQPAVWFNKVQTFEMAVRLA